MGAYQHGALNRSRVAGPIVGALTGLAALVSGSSATAQDVKPIAYRDTNLAQYGVPNFEGLKPFETKLFDRVDSIPGDETKFEAYEVGKGFVATYSVQNRIYAVSFEVDGKKPLDYVFIDKAGHGDFSQVDTHTASIPPSWVIQ